MKPYLTEHEEKKLRTQLTILKTEIGICNSRIVELEQEIWDLETEADKIGEKIDAVRSALGLEDQS